MSDIVEFLEARIYEDEERASSGWARLGDTRWETDNYGRNFLTPSAVLAECAAKRAIIEQASEASSNHWQVVGEFVMSHEDIGSDPGDLILQALAAVYKDHPDYKPDWT